MGSRNNSVGIASRYGVDVTGIESRCGEIFVPIQTGSVAFPASERVSIRSLPGGKAAGVCR
jgi:hypothetical protein